MNKILTYLKTIAEAWKGILAIAGVISVVAIVAVKIDHWKSNNIDTDKSLKDIKTTINNQAIKIDSILLKVQIVEGIKSDIGELKGGQKKIVNALGDHMAKDKSVTKDDLLNFLRQFQYEQEKKKSMTGYLLIPSPIKMTQSKDE